MIDQFSKWVECSAIPEQSTERVVQEPPLVDPFQMVRSKDRIGPFCKLDVWLQAISQNWDKDLPLALMVIRFNVQKSTGFTPIQVMLGRETINQES